MTTTVVYYSLSGKVREAATTVARNLSAALVELKPTKPYPTGAMRWVMGGRDALFNHTPEIEPVTLSNEPGDLIVVCSPIWAGTVAPPVLTFLTQYGIHSRNVALLLSSSGGKVEGVRTKLAKINAVFAAAPLCSLVDDDNPAIRAERVANFCQQLTH